jgi:hypothetical protein
MLPPHLNDALALLVGKSMLGTARALDMEMFWFGDATDFVDRLGERRPDPRYAFHVQARWKLRCPNGLVAEYEDLFVPAPPDSGGTTAPDDGETLRDVRLREFFAAKGDMARSVTSCASDPRGNVEVVFDDGCALFIAGSGTRPGAEAWRFVERHGDHLVCVNGETELVLRPRSIDDPGDRRPSR